MMFLLMLLSLVTIEVTPKFNTCLPHSQVRVVWRIPRHPDNKWYSMSWVSTEGESGSTFNQMDKDSPELYDRWVNVQCADYVFEACVYRSKEKLCSKYIFLVP